MVFKMMAKAVKFTQHSKGDKQNISKKKLQKAIKHRIGSRLSSPLISPCCCRPPPTDLPLTLFLSVPQKQRECTKRTALCEQKIQVRSHGIHLTLPDTGFQKPPLGPPFPYSYQNPFCSNHLTPPTKKPPKTLDVKQCLTSLN